MFFWLTHCRGWPGWILGSRRSIFNSWVLVGLGEKKTDTQMFGPWFVSNVYFLDGTQPGEEVNDDG